MGIWKNFDKRRNNAWKKFLFSNITYNDITIQRTKRPNRLVYTKQNEIYEDNEAQIYINEYFG